MGRWRGADTRRDAGGETIFPMTDSSATAMRHAVPHRQIPPHPLRLAGWSPSSHLPIRDANGEEIASFSPLCYTPASASAGKSVGGRHAAPRLTGRDW